MDDLRIIDPKKLQAGIPCRRIDSFGYVGYKPSITRLDDGELLLVNFHGHSEAQVDGGKCEHTMIFRSKDNGVTWTGSHYENLHGREPYLNHFKNDILMLTAHMTKNNSENDRSRVYTVIHRSDDKGYSWDSKIIDLGEDDDDVGETTSTRNILELGNNKYIFGVGTGHGREYLLVSADGGRRWDKYESSVKGVKAEGSGCYIFQEGVFFLTDTGRLMMLARCSHDMLDPEKEIPGVPQYDYKKTGTYDHFDFEVLFESKDEGLTWEPIRAINMLSCMYPSVCSLGNGKYLITVTIRTPFGGSRMGVQAFMMEEMPDGQIVFHENEDRIVIDEKTPDYLQSGGGFGNTIILDDGTCLTPYSYHWADEDITELMISGRFIEKDVFEKMRKKAEIYHYKWASGFDWDMIKDRHEDMQRHCFLGCCDIMNLCGTRTELAIWKLPEEFRR